MGAPAWLSVPQCRESVAGARVCAEGGGGHADAGFCLRQTLPVWAASALGGCPRLPRRWPPLHGHAVCAPCRIWASVCAPSCVSLAWVWRRRGPRTPECVCGSGTSRGPCVTWCDLRECQHLRGDTWGQVPGENLALTGLVRAGAGRGSLAGRARGPRWVQAVGRPGGPGFGSECGRLGWGSGAQGWALCQSDSPVFCPWAPAHTHALTLQHPDH